MGRTPSTRVSSERCGAGAALVAASACLLGGCISVYHYQPLGGLHRSYAISYKEANFEGLTLGLKCVPSQFLKPAMAGRLCDRMRSLFEGQGATVVDLEDEVTGGPAPVLTTTPGETTATVEARVESTLARTNYVLVFEAKETYLQRNPWMWPVSISLLTFFPAEQEYAFEQVVTVTRGDGSPVGRHSFEARFTWFWGFGYWFLNKVFNWTVRDDAEDVSDATMRRDFSRDVYGQVSQVLYNARAKDAFLALARPDATNASAGTDATLPGLEDAPAPAPAPGPGGPP